MKNLLCLLFNCHSGSGWRECSHCQLKRVKLMRRMRHRKRAMMLGLIALTEPCSSIGGANQSGLVAGSAFLEFPSLHASKFQKCTP